MFNLIEFVGKVSSFGARIVVDGLRMPFEGNQILTQIAEVGYKSLPLVVPAGFALGTVMTFHTRSTLVTFGASAMIPTVQALAFFCRDRSAGRRTVASRTRRLRDWRRARQYAGG